MTLPASSASIETPSAAVHRLSIGQSGISCRQAFERQSKLPRDSFTED